MKQTAVEFLVEQLNNGEFLDEELIKQANEMFEQQIIYTYIECKRQYVYQENCYPPQFVVKEAEQYYNEQFKNK